MDGKEKVNEMKKNCRIPCFPSRVLVPSVAVLAVAATLGIGLVAVLAVGLITSLPALGARPSRALRAL